MIWDLNLMRKVGRLYASGMLDLTYVLRDDGGVAEAAHKTKVAERLINTAREQLGVEIDMRDVGFQELEYGMVGQRDYIAKWQPMHGRVTLAGGMRDGEEMQVEPNLVAHGHPLVFPQLASGPDLFYQDGDAASAAVPTRNLEYRLSGYHEKLVAWVYRFYL